jgi:hypothetical protein
MKNLVRGMMVFITVIPFVIGYLCYTISYNCFINFLIFGVPMILVRVAHMILVMSRK